jgi:hypothetical protein
MQGMDSDSMNQRELPELVELEQILDDGAAYFSTTRMCNVAAGSREFPVYSIALGSTDPAAPAVGFFGGVHGLERIGSQVLLAFMRSILTRLRWDKVLQHQLESIRLVFMPIVNPGGMWMGTRCNPRGVDLMRNSPIESVEKVPFMVGGQRYSARLPWYRGAANAPMEAENLAVAKVVADELLCRRFSVVLDCHSGFGLRDRIWFPYAHSRAPFEYLAEVYALKNLFDRTYPNHPYLFEPQCRQYLTHGDLWDYLCQCSTEGPNRVFLPLTLELGSWLWIKKNPRQAFSLAGMFNPVVPHRQQRVLRSHMLWLDFLTRAASAHQHWLPEPDERKTQQDAAFANWY